MISRMCHFALNRSTVCSRVYSSWQQRNALHDWPFMRKSSLCQYHDVITPILWRHNVQPTGMGPVLAISRVGPTLSQDRLTRCNQWSLCAVSKWNTSHNVCDLHTSRHIHARCTLEGRTVEEKCLSITLSTNHYSDAMMSAMASQITSTPTVCSAVCWGTDKKTIKAPRHWPLWGKSTDDRWISLTKRQ